MNKNAIQKFAVWARTEMIAQVSQRAYQYGITKESYGVENAVTVNGRALSTNEQRQRAELVQQIKIKGYDQVMEEVAYTWFNRFIALRYMEVNNYLPSHIRVFSDASGAFNPEILKEVLHLELDGLDKQKVAAYIEQNQTDDLYRYLLLTQCNALNAALPGMFERLGSYTELLLPNNILKADSILGRLVDDIPEEDWTDQVQIIGWLYQYYNEELKEETYALLKKNVKVTKERIPSATQLFTPDWIVRYMVENSLGRLWLDGHPNNALKENWKYYLDEAKQEADVEAELQKIRAEHANIQPQDIKIIDPCMGSGHILVYAFDVLIQIYEANGISQRDAAQSILQHNLYGLDIDDRAAQLAYFAVMMKARQYDRRIFSRNTQPYLYALQNSQPMHEEGWGYFGTEEPLARRLWQAFTDAKTLGSLVPLDLTLDELTRLRNRLADMDAASTMGSLSAQAYVGQILDTFAPLVELAEILTQKYDVVITNPPYMGSSNMDKTLSDFVKKQYPDSKSDLFAVFIERCKEMVKENGYQAMITQHAWMFLSSYEKLRKKLLQIDTINMAHLGPRAFDEIGGEVVQTTSFILQNCHVPKRKGTYVRLIDYKSESEKEQAFLSTDHCPLYTIDQSNFSKIPGSPVAYWVSEDVLQIFRHDSLATIVDAVKGLDTCNNDLFVRQWEEVDIKKIGFNISEVSKTYDYKWYPYSKGGGFRKWYGFNEIVVNWENNGEVLKNLRNDKGKIKSRPQNIRFYFQEGLTWSSITSYKLSLRYMNNSIFGGGGSALFMKQDYKQDLHYILGLINSKVTDYILRIINPTMNYLVNDILKIPVILNDSLGIEKLVKENIGISKDDYDNFEISFGFKKHPLAKEHKVSDAFQLWSEESSKRFKKLYNNEKSLNAKFIDLYRLSNDIDPLPETKEIGASVSIANLETDIRSLLSYAVGCMFGRYSLDVEGLVYAGGKWDAGKYTTFIPDEDNIIPICDDDYFEDDITGRFVQWVEVVYGKETLEENLTFIADALGGKGTSREIIRNYFLKEFYKDHCHTYKKRPIYWLFDSGKKNGFKALIYMHRYQPDLLARMRTDYVHEQQERYRTRLAHIDDILPQASGSDRVKLTKQQKKLQDQSLEIQQYEEKIHHLADQNITIDLDDGVKHNYALFADILVRIK